MKSTILGIRISNWTVKRIYLALKDSKIDKDSWSAGYSLAKAEGEVYNEYRNENITESEYDIISTFLRNITINYKEEIRENIYKKGWSKKNHINKFLNAE